MYHNQIYLVSCLVKLCYQTVYQVSQLWKLVCNLSCQDETLVDRDIKVMEERGETCQDTVKKLSTGLLGKV
jgi:hypothetical protein